MESLKLQGRILSICVLCPVSHIHHVNSNWRVGGSRPGVGSTWCLRAWLGGFLVVVYGVRRMIAVCWSGIYMIETADWRPHKSRPGKREFVMEAWQREVAGGTWAKIKAGSGEGGTLLKWSKVLGEAI